jgi:hypothetical protein
MPVIICCTPRNNKDVHETYIIPSTTINKDAVDITQANVIIPSGSKRALPTGNFILVLTDILLRNRLVIHNMNPTMRSRKESNVEVITESELERIAAVSFPKARNTLIIVES